MTIDQRPAETKFVDQINRNAITSQISSIRASPDASAPRSTDATTMRMSVMEIVTRKTGRHIAFINAFIPEAIFPRPIAPLDCNINDSIEY